MSSMTVCDSGTSAAPKLPCSRRKSTICSMLWAMPHNSDAKVKPATQMMNSFLRPSRSEIQPIGDVSTAAATI